MNNKTIIKFNWNLLKLNGAIKNPEHKIQHPLQILKIKNKNKIKFFNLEIVKMKDHLNKFHKLIYKVQYNSNFKKLKIRF